MAYTAASLGTRIRLQLMTDWCWRLTKAHLARIELDA